jgi:putative ABC transport system substrate-binding protein
MRLQFLKALVPQASRIAVLINPTHPAHPREQAKLPEIGRLRGVELFVVEASKPDQFETAFETAHTQGAEAIHVIGDPFIFLHRAKVVGLAARYRLPAMNLNPRFVQDGGLMSYGPNDVGLWLAGAYVDKILKGERASVQSPTRTRRWFTICCSARRPKRCSRSPPIAGTLARVSVPPPCSTAGARQ